MKKKKKYRITAVIMTLLMILGLTTAVSLASDLPSESTQGSITVHKYSTASASQTPGTGLELSHGDAAKLGTPLQGVGFTLRKVNSSYTMESTTTVDEAKQNSTVISEKFTGKDGSVSWEELSIGYYVLVETTPPGDGYIKAPDSIITLPMGITSTGSGWNFNIHVYPKNVKTSDLSKEVLNEESFYNYGDVVSWRIDNKIADPLREDTEYGKYKLSDPLDSRLTFVDESDILIATGGTTYPIILTRATDYTVSLEENNTVVWELKNPGIDKIADAGAQAISVQLDTTINASAIDSAQNTNPIITNGANVEWETFDNNSKSLSIDDNDKPDIELGGITIRKIDSINKDLLLDGAEFKIAMTREDAQAGVYIKGGALNEDIVVKTGDNPHNQEPEEGWGKFSGLYVSSTSETKYYLVETKAPTGYVLRQSILEISIPEGEKTTNATIENQKIGNLPLPEENPTFILPQTGGFGTIAFSIIGILLIMAALTAVASNTVREYKEESENTKLIHKKES